jgi:hypothetical protein
MGEINTYRILVGKPEKKRLDVDGKTLKFIIIVVRA